jgi:LPS-assembly protein
LLPLPFCIALSLSAHAADDSPVDWGLCPIEPAVPTFDDAQAPVGDAEARGTQPTDIEGDSLDGVQGQTLNYNGNVALRRGDQFLGTDKLTYDQATNRYVAEGSVRYQDSGMRLVAERAEGDQNLDAHKIDNVKYQLISRRGNGGADRIEMKGEQGALYGATYTTCPPDETGWALHSQRIDVDTEEGFGTARNATVRVGKVPVLWVPYIKFPIDDRRRTGLLYPVIGSSGRNGFDWRQPIYLNLAPNYDMTLTPRLMTKRGLMLNSQFRYLTPSGVGLLDVGYLPSDDLTDREREEEITEVPIVDNRRGDDRAMARFRGVHNLTKQWRAVARLNWVSDARYLEDFSNTLAGLSNYSIGSDIGLYGTGRTWAAGLMADHDQITDYKVSEASLPYDRLPRAYARWEESFGRWFTAGVDSEAVHFRHVDEFDDRDLDGDGVLEPVSVRPGGTRFDIKPYIALPLEGASWFLKPSVAWRYTGYSLDDTALAPDRDSSPTRSLPIASVDAGLFFDRETSIGDEQYLHTLEPRLFYLNVPYRDQAALPRFDTRAMTYSWGQLFRDNRFTGADRQADANQMTLALSSRLIRESDGREKLSASIGQIRYFDDSLVTDSPCPTPGSINCPGTIERGTSSWIADATYAVNDRWTLNASYQWNPRFSKKDLVSLRTRYLIGDDGIVNLNYRYRRNTTNQLDLLEQVDLSFLYPINPTWSLVGRYYYSLLDDATHEPGLLEGIFGVQWDSCCVAMRLVGRRYVRSSGELNSAIQLEIELKGLGSAGPDTKSRLRRAILGYQREDLYLVPPSEVVNRDDVLDPDSSSPVSPSPDSIP